MVISLMVLVYIDTLTKGARKNFTFLLSLGRDMETYHSLSTCIRGCLSTRAPITLADACSGTFGFIQRQLGQPLVYTATMLS